MQTFLMRTLKAYAMQQNLRQYLFRHNAFLCGPHLLCNNSHMTLGIVRCLTQVSTDPNRGSPAVSSSVIQQCLMDMKMRFETGHTTIITTCPRVNRSTKDSSLSINTTSGHFVCESCNRQGSWPDLMDNLLSLKNTRRKSSFVCFKDLDHVIPFLEENSQAKEIWNNCKSLGKLQNGLALKIREMFYIDAIKTATLDAFQVRCDPNNFQLVFPIIVNKHITGLKRLSCNMNDKTSGAIKESYIPRSGPSFVFGLDNVKASATEVVLTSSEIDAMAVTQETGKPAIALPRGYSSLPQEILPMLERFHTVILWFGDDVRSWEMAKMFSRKLNSKRCHIIGPSVDEPGPFTALMQGLKLSQILKMSRPVSHDSIVNFSHLRQEIFNHLLHSDQVAGVKWKRYPLLNKYLKGHRRGELTVFTGPTGSGKTTFISDYSLDLCMEGVNTLWGSFEINNVRLGKMMLTQFAMKNMTKHVEHFDYYADQFQLLPMYFMTFHGQESIKRVIDAMSHAVYVHDIAHVIVDNLQFMMGTAGNDWSDRFMKQDSMVAAFRKFATNMNCHVTLVIHPRKEKETDDLTTASIFGSAKATQEADNVMILQDRTMISTRGRKYLQITKNRFDGDLGMMILKFDKETLSFASRDKDKPVKKPNQEDPAEVVETAPSSKKNNYTTLQEISFNSEECGENEEEEL